MARVRIPWGRFPRTLKEVVSMLDLLDLTCWISLFFVIWYKAWDYVYFDVLSKEDEDA